MENVIMEPLNFSMESTYKEVTEFPAHDVSLVRMLFTSIKTCVVVATLLLGLCTIITLIWSGCRNSFSLIVILLSGLLLELYCFVKTQECQTVLFNVDSPEQLPETCADFHLPALFANSIILLTMTLNAMKTNTIHIKQKLWLRNFFFVQVCVACAGLTVMYIKVPQLYGQNALLSTDSRTFYMSICTQAIEEALLPFILETVLLYLPLLVTIFIMHRSNKGKDMEISPRRFTKPCHVDLQGRGRCMICDIDSVLLFLFYNYVFVLLILRPGMFVYNACVGHMIRDFLPSFVGVVQYSVLTITCTWNLVIKVKHCREI